MDDNAIAGTIWASGVKRRTYSTVVREQGMFADLEGIFAPKKIVKKVAKKKEKKPGQVSTLDSKRLQNLGIALSRVWKGDWAELANCVQNLNLNRIGSDAVENLLKVLPTSAEIKGVQAYKGDIAMLNKCDLFIMEIGKVTRLKPRIECMVFQARFDELIAPLSSNISALQLASDEIRASTKFPELLGIILTVGNKLNQNTAKQNAAGVKLEGLMKLAQTKSNSGITVLDYIVMNLGRNTPELLQIAEDLPHLKAASGINIDTLKADVAKMNKGMQQIKSQFDMDLKKGEYTFQTAMGEFYGKAEVQVEALNNSNTKMLATYAEVAKFLLAPKLPPETLFKQILNFLDLMKRSEKTVAERAARKKKAMQREAAKKKREEAKARRERRAQGLDSDSD